MNVFGLKHIIFKQFLNVEILDQTLNQSYCDLVIEAEDGKIYIIEFQSSGPAKKDKIRFGDYQTTLHRKKKGQKVIVIMITINDDPDNDEPYGYDKEYRYRINKRSTTCFNTEKVIKELEFKAENDCFDDEAYVKLQLLYYMESNGDERKKLLKKGVEIKNKIKNLSTDRKVGLTLIYMALAVHNFEEEELERFKEELKMNMSIEEYAVMGINHHIEERNKHLKKELEEKDKEHKKELEEKDEEIQAKDKEHKKEIQAKDEEINKIRKLFKDFSESGDKKAMNTLKTILL
ncbi:hypothetical protein [Methanobrevibacter ruminantium]|uniref:hypothetical protein n=1 Tax=Methanobrevibacter ruminantium TaxID=83816 RepID=UPI00117D6985|nr:hypothetical protein [Methanobrevibacter ruminantium]